MEIILIGKSDPGYPASLTRFLPSNAPDGAAAIGNLEILTRSKVAIFCSAMCPETLKSGAYELIQMLDAGGVTAIGGFHSPIERGCLEILLNGAQPIIISPARSLDKLRIRPEYRAPLQQGRLLFLSFFKHHRHRSDVEMAFRRNCIVAALADLILILHAAPGSNTERLCQELSSWQKAVYTIDHPANRNLLRSGVQALPLDRLRALIIDYCRRNET